MKVLLVLASFLWLGADAHHTAEHLLSHHNVEHTLSDTRAHHTPEHLLGHHNAEHTLSDTPWHHGKTYRYLLVANMTAGIPGMTTQVAKSVIKMEVSIKHLTGAKYVLKADQVLFSRPSSSAGTRDEPVSFVRYPEMEREISKPIIFFYEDGKITTYTLGKHESLPSRSIKRGILRHLEMKIHPDAKEPRRGEDHQELFPIVYNATGRNELGTYNVYYGIVVSPYPWFPYETNVYNVSKTIDYDPYGYPTIHEHDNFAKTGCPSVCRLSRSNTFFNKYGAGCPCGYEPYQNPLKASIVVHHNYRLWQSQMVIESINSHESSVASMYDQDIEINVESQYSLREISTRNIPEPSDPQEEYHALPLVPTQEDLEIAHPERPNDVAVEYRWIYGIFPKLSSDEVMRMAEYLLHKVSTSVMAGDIESTSGQEITQDIAQLQDVMSLLKKENFETLWTKIPNKRSLRTAPEEEKIKRQIFLDILPLCGTDESINYITFLVREKKLSVWEAKEVLEAIPSNIIKVTNKKIQDLWELIELPDVKRYHILHSAAHLTLASTIREGCVVPGFSPDDSDDEDDSTVGPTLWQTVRKSSSKRPGFKTMYGAAGDDDEPSLCSQEIVVERFLQEMRLKMKSARKLQEKIVYIQAIAQIGHKDVLEFLKPYTYGLADDIASFKPGDVDYIKTVALYALHHVVGYYPEDTLEMAAAIFFNRTEMPRVRNAAFSVLIRSEPPLGVLQHVAQDLWDEPSNEVGSYVYSALQTFGNTSAPCMKLTADRIKLIISQAKAYDIGSQHSKSIYKTFFDDLNKFTVETRFAMVHSNESYVPHSLYSSLRYGLHSMQDVLMMFAANIQGVNTEELFRLLDLPLWGLKIPGDIDSSAENEIFGTLSLNARLPKDLRIAIYKKIFYTSSYSYFDKDNYEEFLDPLRDYLRDYLSSEGGVTKGHLVKTFIPSSLHSLTYSGSGLPVDFRMKHPLVLSVKVESKSPQVSSGLSFSYYIRPSAYYATYHTKSILNIWDRHVYGVYHEKKHTFTFPVELSVSKDSASNTLEVKCKLPEIPKRIYSLRSEAGTFEAELKFSKIYKVDLNTDAIEVVPALFKREHVVSAFGLPPLNIAHHNEEISGHHFDLPHSLEDMAKMAINIVGNPGWRRKYVNATIVSRSSSPVDEITFRISYDKKLDIARETISSNSWKKPSGKDYSSWMSWKFGTRDEDEDVEPYTDSPYSEDESEDLSEIWGHGSSGGSEDEELTSEQATKVTEAFSGKLSKIAYEFVVNVETRPIVNAADLRVEYNCTFDRMIHSFKAQAEARTAHNRTPYKMCITHVMRYQKSPSEFHYDIEKYTGQSADFVNGISFGDECKPFGQSDVIAMGSFYKVPSKDLFSHDEFVEYPERTAFYPETHGECMKDTHKGKSQSPACISATVAAAHLNKFSVVVRARDVPPALLNVTYKLDRAIKNYYYGSVDINRVNVHNPPKTLRMVMNYYETLTDTPFVKVWMKTPKENVIYRRINSKYLQPLSSVFTLPDSYVLQATNNTYPPSCGLMEKHVRTYDMKVYPLPRDTCTYVLSTHCTERKKFAVLAKRTSDSRYEKEATIYVAGNKVELKPSRSSDSYELVHNGDVVQVTRKKPVLLDEETKMYAYLVPVHGHAIKNVLNFHSDVTGVKIQYDGKNVKLQVNPLYKGLLCGLCSEFDGEITREYRGPDQCLYLDDEEFAHSSVTNVESCGVNPQPSHPVICPSESNFFPRNRPSSFSEVVTPRYPYSPEDEDNSFDLQGPSGRSQPIPRTLYVERRNFVCFTTRPVPVCDEGNEAEEEYDVDVDYHCLPKNDVTTARLIAESMYRVLSELANKQVDFSETVPAARSCSSY